MKLRLLPIVFLISTAAAPLAQSTVAGEWQLHIAVSGYESDQSCTFSQNGKI
jgi:hypothetical protein